MKKPTDFHQRELFQHLQYLEHYSLQSVQSLLPVAIRQLLTDEDYAQRFGNSLRGVTDISIYADRKEPDTKINFNFWSVTGDFKRLTIHHHNAKDATKEELEKYFAERGYVPVEEEDPFYLSMQAVNFFQKNGNHGIIKARVGELMDEMTPMTSK